MIIDFLNKSKENVLFDKLFRDNHLSELKNNFGNKKENAIDNPIEIDNKNRSEIRNCDLIKKEKNIQDFG